MLTQPTGTAQHQTCLHRAHAQSFRLFLALFVWLQCLCTLCPSLASAASEETAAANDLRTWLHAGEFARLDAYLSTLQQAYEADSGQENSVANALHAFARPLPELEAPFEQWVMAYPQSYAARTARGIYLNSMGWAFRGDAYADKTHRSRFDAMQRYMDKAESDLTAAIDLSPRPIAALAELIDIAKASSKEGALDLLEQAIEADPQCAAPRRSYLTSLQPRWNGSRERMRTFLETTRSLADQPKLQTLVKLMEGDILIDQASDLTAKRNYSGALELYQQAAMLTHNTYAEGRLGWLYLKLGQYDNAMRYLDGVLKQSPDDDWSLRQRSWLHFKRNQTESGLADLRRASELGNVDAMQKLAYMHATGESGVPADDAEALKWSRRAAYFLESYSQAEVGRAYLNGLGVPIDLAAAAKWYRLAAEQDYGIAQNELGLLLWYGRGVPVDKEAAARYWRLAADQNVWQGQHNLKFFLQEDYPLGGYGKAKRDAVAARNTVFGILAMLEETLPYGRRIGSLVRTSARTIQGPNRLKLFLGTFSTLLLLIAGSALLGRRLSKVPASILTPGNDVPVALLQELGENESILWWGRPRSGFIYDRVDYLTMGSGLLLLVLALFWLDASLQQGAPLWAVVAGGLVLLFGLHLLALRHILDAMRRARTLYALTPQRALIVGWSLGRLVRSLPLRSLRAMTFVAHADGSGSILFSTSRQAPPAARSARARGLEVGDSAFTAIDQAKSVQQMIMQLQTQGHPAPEQPSNIATP
jgi:tetratricopeptide (TPR) repeat protein